MGYVMEVVATVGQIECPEPIKITTSSANLSPFRVSGIPLPFASWEIAVHATAIHLLESETSRLIMLLAGELKDVAEQIGVSVKTARRYQYKDAVMPLPTKLLCLHLVGFYKDGDVWDLRR